jgi:glycosyltransferase involved in cell wall biosynthesis
MDFLCTQLMENIKKTCFIVPQLYPNFVGGAEVFNYYLIKELAKKNEVTYISLNKEDIPKASKIKLKSKSHFFQQLEILWRILSCSRDEVIVHSLMKTKWYYIIAFPLLKIFFNKKYTIIIHGGGMMKWKWEFPFKLYFKNARVVFGVSLRICEEYFRRTNVEINYLPPLIPFQESKKEKITIREIYNIKEDSKVFLIVGSLKELKRPMVVLEAFNELGLDVLRKNEICVFFAGNGPLKGKMEDYIKKNHLEKHIKLLGNVPRERINEFYKLSDYYIISSDFEGTPISMLEAMFNKLLIIGSNAPGIGNIIKDSEGGFLFKNDNPKNLSLIIKKVIIHDFIDERENAFRFFINNFSYQQVLRKFISKI